MMPSNIFAALEKLGLSPQKRALHIQFSQPALNTDVFLQRIDGKHQLNDGLHADSVKTVYRRAGCRRSGH